MSATPWLHRAVMTLRTRDARMSTMQLRRELGEPPGGRSAYKILADAESKGYVHSIGTRSERAYGPGDQTPPGLDPPCRLDAIGRGAPRYPSIFHLAQGVEV